MKLPTPETIDASTRLARAMDALAEGILSGLGEFPPEERNALTAYRLDWFAARWLRIRTKKGGAAVRFALNWVQMDFLKRLRKASREPGTVGIDRFRGIRANVLKPRQLGFSTFIAALFFCDGILNPGRVSLVVTHLQKMSLELIKTYRLFWACLPAEFKAGLHLEVDSKYEFAVAFPPGPDDSVLPPSRWIIWTEKGEEWRGGVIHNLHGSEAAFYADYLGWKTAFFQAVDQESGNIILETTANGMNSYYDDVQAALRGDSSFTLVFYPWHVHPEYQRTWDEAKEAPPTPWEQEQMTLHGWTLEQLAWRRWKVGEIGSEERFRQEFPATVDEAFLTTGRPFFPLTKVAATLARLNAAPPSFLEPRPHVRIYEVPVVDEVCVLSADIAEGLDAGSEVPGHPERGGSDYCCAYVLAVGSLRVKASIHGRIPPAEFARLCDWLGRQYQACVAPERNNHGHTVVHILQESWYPWLYRHLEYDDSGQATFARGGFPTDGKTRPQILDALWSVVNAGTLYCPDAGFYRECQTFHRHEKTGKPEALDGYHDDRVMALAIAVYLSTLGRSAWGQPTGSWADASGLPVGEGEVAIPRVEPAALPPPAPVPAPLDGQASDLAPIAQAIVAHRPDSCGACMWYVDGYCTADAETGGLKLRVGANDPGCAAHCARLETPSAALWGADPSTVGA